MAINLTSTLCIFEALESKLLWKPAMFADVFTLYLDWRVNSIFWKKEKSFYRLETKLRVDKFDSRCLSLREYVVETKISKYYFVWDGLHVYKLSFWYFVFVTESLRMETQMNETINWISIRDVFLTFFTWGCLLNDGSWLDSNRESCDSKYSFLPLFLLN